MDYFSCIPDEVVHVIFGYSPAQTKLSLRLTCRRLFRVGADPSLWKVISVSHVTHNSVWMLKYMITLAGQTLRFLRIVGGCLPSKYWKEVLKCRNLETLEVFGARITVAQLKKLINSDRPLTRLGFDIGMYGPLEFREYLSVVRDVSDVTIRMHTKRQGVGLASDLVVTWATQGYSPKRLSIADLDAYVTDYAPNLFMGIISDLHLPACTSHSAALKVYISNVMTLDLLPTPPVVEFQVDTGANVLKVSKSQIPGEKIVQFCLSCISDNAMSGRYFSEGFYQRQPYYVDRPFGLIAASLIHLDLTNMKSLLPEHLLQIGEHCSSLKQLVLNCCDSCLTSLEGINKVALKCPLKGLSLTGIIRDAVPCTVELWNILSSIRTLTHLSMEGCLLQPHAPKQMMPMKKSAASDVGCVLMPQTLAELSQIGHSMRKLENLVALEVQCYGCCRHCKRLTDDHLEVLSCLVGLVYLRVKSLPAFHYTKWLTMVFTKCLLLKYVYISNAHGNVMLPTDPAAYSSLEQFHFESPDQQLSNDSVGALISAGKLTHLFLVLNSMNADVVLKLARDMEHLVCCHVNIFQQVRNVRSLHAALKVLSKEQPYRVETVFKHALYRYPERTYLSAIASSELVPLHSGNAPIA